MSTTSRYTLTNLDNNETTTGTLNELIDHLEKLNFPEWSPQYPGKEFATRMIAEEFEAEEHGLTEGEPYWEDWKEEVHTAQPETTPELVEAYAAYTFNVHPSRVTIKEAVATERQMSGAHFRALRSYLGFSVKEIAQYLGVSQNSARDWDKGVYAPPAGVVQDLNDLAKATDMVVEYFTRRYSQSTIEWPMEIPRKSEDIPAMVPELIVPGPVTLDWWKHVGIRVCQRVPGLTLEWV